MGNLQIRHLKDLKEERLNLEVVAFLAMIPKTTAKTVRMNGNLFSQSLYL